LATQTRAPRKNQARLNQLTARALRQPTTAVHASLAQQKLAHLHHVGKTALRAPSTVMHAQLVTHAIHVMHAQQPVETSDATGAQHLLHAAATFSAMTVTHVRPAMAQHLVASKTDLLALLIAMHVRPELLTATHAQRAMGQHHVVSKTDLHALSIVTHAHRVTHVMVAHLVVSKIVRPELLIVIHAQRATHAMAQHLVASKTDHNVIRTSLVQPVLSEAQPLLGTRVTHAQRATHAMVTRVRLALSTEQNLAAHASSTTDHASLIATTATTAPTVAQTALTV
jgi:hypothetical protein